MILQTSSSDLLAIKRNLITLEMVISALMTDGRRPRIPGLPFSTALNSIGHGIDDKEERQE